MLELRFQQGGQLLSPGLCRDSPVVVTVVIPSHGGHRHHLGTLQQERIGVRVLKCLTLGETYVSKEFTAVQFVAGIRVEVTSTEPVVTDGFNDSVMESQQMLLGRTSVMHHDGIFKNVIGRMFCKHGQQGRISTFGNKVVRVGKGDVLSCRRFYSCVSCCRKSLVGLADKPAVSPPSCHLLRNLSRGIRRSVVNDEHFHPVVHLFQYTFQTASECIFNVIDGYDDGQFHAIIV